jgi:hypothetical protein
VALKYLQESPVGITWVMDEPMERASHALASDGQVWLVDPVDDPEAMEQVESLGEPVAVIQLLDRHGRDCRPVADRLGIPLLRLPDTLPDAPFAPIPVIDNRLWKEKALWWNERRALVVAEAIGTAPLFHPSKAGAGVHIALRMNPPKRQLGTYLPDHLMVGHGPDIRGPGATEALQQAIDHSRRGLPGALLAAPRALFGK